MPRQDEYERRLLPSNPDCIHAGRLGYGCRCLWAVDPGCYTGECPFFKTEEEQARVEAYCKKRLEELDKGYHTREETFSSYNRQKERKRKYYESLRNR